MIENMVSLSESTVQEMTTGQALSLGGSVTLLGVAVVFLALVALILITWLYPKIAKAIIAKVADIKANEQIEADEVVFTADTSVEAQKADDTQLIAVIAAAVAASLGTSSNGIVIRSIKRSASNVPAWGNTGRQEQVYNRF